VLEHPLPLQTTINGMHDMTLLHGKVQPALHQKLPKLLEHGTIFFQYNAAPC
jgi:hypothetical protein